MGTDKVESVTAKDLSRIAGQEFAILEDGNDLQGLTYMQCGERDGETYTLEYQEGSIEQHYRAMDPRLPLARVIAAFTKYLQDDKSWKADFRWERIVIE